jgi:AraC-like DNA-binding protein
VPTPARTKPASDYLEHEALLAEAAFFCETVDEVRLTGNWMPVAQEGFSDKVYAVTAGRGVLHLDDGRYDLKAGQVMIVPSGTVQQGFTDPDAPLTKHYVHFRSVTAMAVHLLRFYPPPRRLGGASARAITGLCRQMLEEWRCERPGRQLALRGTLMRIMLTAYRADPKDVLPADDLRGLDRETARPNDDQYDAVRRALACVTSRYREPITLNDLAAAARLTGPYFNTLFARLVGLPPMHFLESVRMRKARELLAGSDTPVAQVAAAVGFADANYFSRAFRRKVGVSPSAYRAASRP